MGIVQEPCSNEEITGKWSVARLSPLAENRPRNRPHAVPDEGQPVPVEQPVPDEGQPVPVEQPVPDEVHLVLDEVQPVPDVVQPVPNEGQAVPDEVQLEQPVPEVVQVVPNEGQPVSEEQPIPDEVQLELDEQPVPDVVQLVPNEGLPAQYEVQSVTGEVHPVPDEVQPVPDDDVQPVPDDDVQPVPDEQPIQDETQLVLNDQPVPDDGVQPVPDEQPIQDETQLVLNEQPVPDEIPVPDKGQSILNEQPVQDEQHVLYKQLVSDQQLVTYTGQQVPYESQPVIDDQEQLLPDQLVQDSRPVSVESQPAPDENPLVPNESKPDPNAENVIFPTTVPWDTDMFLQDGELMDTDESFSPVSSSTVQHILELLPESPKKKAEPRFKVGDYVTVSLPMGKKKKCFVAEVLGVDEEVKELWLKYMKESPVGFYQWPKKTDYSWESFSTINKTMPKPVLSEKKHHWTVL